MVQQKKTNRERNAYFTVAATYTNYAVCYPWIRWICNFITTVLDKNFGGPEALGPLIFKSWGDRSHGSHRAVAPMALAFFWQAKHVTTVVNKLGLWGHLNLKRAPTPQGAPNHSLESVKPNLKTLGPHLLDRCWNIWYTLYSPCVSVRINAAGYISTESIVASGVSSSTVNSIAHR